MMMMKPRVDEKGNVLFGDRRGDGGDGGCVVDGRTRVEAFFVVGLIYFFDLLGSHHHRGTICY